jgi:hypothetical protein
MTTILDVLSWANGALTRWGKDHIQITECTDTNLKFKIYTDNNSYSIFAVNAAENKPNGYLGCISTSRKPRAGEDWHRGSDLADGPLSEETWHRILADIVSYELVKVHKPKAPTEVVDTPKWYDYVDG